MWQTLTTLATLFGFGHGNHSKPVESSFLLDIERSAAILHSKLFRPLPFDPQVLDLWIQLNMIQNNCPARELLSAACLDTDLPVSRLTGTTAAPVDMNTPLSYSMSLPRTERDGAVA